MSYIFISTKAILYFVKKIKACMNASFIFEVVLKPSFIICNCKKVI